MSEALLLVGLILAVGSLIDHSWSLRGKTFKTKDVRRPISHLNLPQQTQRKSSQSLRKDWLRLGRRS